MQGKLPFVVYRPQDSSYTSASIPHCGVHPREHDLSNAMTAFSQAYLYVRGPQETSGELHLVNGSRFGCPKQ
jgi:hypothetical protein